ncbi:MAG: 30S ribosome-binding factor RbfA [Bacteroidales bacterium OttesenSCG-928-I14]|jgi:ribosome-binding factor A|nr:30S ribosome-binding factor RbfA [Bacteroidales bacterium OttesenSCG-928-I14]
MENKKLQKIERLIQKEINELFRLQAKQFKKLVIMSVITVRVSPDLGIAKIFLSIYPSNSIINIMDNVKKNKNNIRYNLGLRIGKKIRRVPELFFYVDNSFDYVDNISRLISQNE